MMTEEDSSCLISTPRALIASVISELLCPITHELMVEPVTTNDGYTYERKALEAWLIQNDNKSPMKSELSIINLVPSRIVLKAVEALIESDDIEESLRHAWQEAKKKSDLAKAQDLFDEGNVLEAANLGLPEAQGVLAGRYYQGINGLDKDLNLCVAWATKAAIGGDKQGQFFLGWTYDEGHGVDKDWSNAIKWYELAAAQGCEVSYNNLGAIYRDGGFGVDKDIKKAIQYFQKGAEAGHGGAQCSLGQHYFDGEGILVDPNIARGWFETSAEQGEPVGQLDLAFMLITGQGGERETARGCSLLEALIGDSSAGEKAATYLNKISLAVNEVGRPWA